MAAETSAKTDAAAAAAAEAVAAPQVGQLLQLPNRKSTYFYMCVCIQGLRVCVCDSFKCLATYLNSAACIELTILDTSSIPVGESN